MRVFKFLLRFTFICNIAFLLFIFFRWMELKKPTKETSDRVVAVPFFKDLVITLGFTAIIINGIMIIVYLILLVAGRFRRIPKWLPLINFLFFILQIYYFFFYN